MQGDKSTGVEMGIEILGVALAALIFLFLWGRIMNYLAGE